MPASRHLPAIPNSIYLPYISRHVIIRLCRSCLLIQKHCPGIPGRSLVQSSRFGTMPPCSSGRSRQWTRTHCIYLLKMTPTLASSRLWLSSAKRFLYNLNVVNPAGLIALKIRAYHDLSDRRMRGESVDSFDIKKHRTDVLRLGLLLDGINLKLLHDAVPGLRIIATGSSALDLVSNTREALTGRCWTFNLHPFSQRELLAAFGPLELERSWNMIWCMAVTPNAIPCPGMPIDRRICMRFIRPTCSRTYSSAAVCAIRARFLICSGSLPSSLVRRFLFLNLAAALA